MKGSPMTEPLYEYVIERFGGDERQLLAKMAGPAKKAGMPAIMIAEDQARFLRVLLRTLGAKDCLDVGTLFGYSAAVMALATAPKGKVVTLESVPKHADVAKQNFASLGISRRVEVQVGRAIELMRKMKTKTFDFVLIDADKVGYTDYFEESMRLVRRGGIIAADNTLAWGQVAGGDNGTHDEDVRAIRRFNDHVAARDDVDACLLPIGDGLLVARVKD